MATDTVTDTQPQPPNPDLPLSAAAEKILAHLGGLDHLRALCGTELRVSWGIYGGLLIHWNAPGRRGAEAWNFTVSVGPREAPYLSESLPSSYPVRVYRSREGGPVRAVVGGMMSVKEIHAALLHHTTPRAAPNATEAARTLSAFNQARVAARAATETLRAQKLAVLALLGINAGPETDPHVSDLTDRAWNVREKGLGAGTGEVVLYYTIPATSAAGGRSDDQVIVYRASRVARGGLVAYSNGGWYVLKASLRNRAL